MKIIVTGVTGFIGGETLYQCSQSSAITEIVALSRRPLPESLASHDKVTSIILKGFTKYTPELLQQLAGAEACVWLISTTQGQGNDRTVDASYSLAAAQAFEEHLAPKLPKGRKFRFLQISGILSERDQSKRLWFIEGFRKSMGTAEDVLLNFAREHSNNFEVCIICPGGVLWKDNWFLALLPWLVSWGFILVDQLALSMIAIARSQSSAHRVENRVLVELGRKQLASP